MCARAWVGLSHPAPRSHPCPTSPDSGRNPSAGHSEGICQEGGGEMLGYVVHPDSIPNRIHIIARIFEGEKMPVRVSCQLEYVSHPGRVPAGGDGRSLHEEHWGFNPRQAFLVLEVHVPPQCSISIAIPAFILGSRLASISGFPACLRARTRFGGSREDLTTADVNPPPRVFTTP